MDLVKRAMNSDNKAKNRKSIDNAKEYLDKFTGAIKTMTQLQALSELNKGDGIYRTHPTQCIATSAPIEGFGTIKLLTDENTILAAQIIEEEISNA